MNDTISRVATALFNSGCLKFGSFKLKSGVLSPYYIDVACLLSSPKDFMAIVNAVSREITRIMSFEEVDLLASIELKGALLLPSIACKMELPCVVVRKAEKEYGATGRIVGTEDVKGKRVLFFDDVISEGLSKLEGIKPLEEEGAIVKNIVVLVNRQQGGKEALTNMGYRIHPLASISEVVKFLADTSKISEEQANTVLNYIRNYVPKSG